MKKKFFSILIVLSVLFNVLLIMPYMGTYFTKIGNILFPTEYMNSKDSDKDVTEIVLHKAMHMDGHLYKTSEFSGPASDLPRFFKKMFKKGNIYSFPLGYCYAGISYYILNNQRDDLKDEFCTMADKLIGDEMDMAFSVKYPDQLSYGIMYINLYKITGKKEYKIVADKFYNKALSFTDGNNIISYLPHKESGYVDVVGMIVPFLKEYYDLTGDSLANRIALDNISYYKAMCVDEKTGIPHHGFSSKYGIPIGSVNWGRGIGWYLLALAYYPDITEENLLQTIKKLPPTQFPGTEGARYDSSTNLLFEIFLQSRSHNRNYNLNEIKKHIRRDGIIDFCSGDTYGYNDYSHTYGGSELCSGLYLMLVSKFSNQIEKHSRYQ